MPLSEATDLDWNDVDLPAAKVVFRMTKNSAPRAASLPMAAVPALAGRLQARWDRRSAPPDLRHTWASWFYAVSKDPMLAKAEGRWKSLDMVERYAHLMPGDLVPAITTVWGVAHPRLGVLPSAKLVQGVAPPPKAVQSQ